MAIEDEYDALLNNPLDFLGRNIVQASWSPSSGTDLGRLYFSERLGFAARFFVFSTYDETQGDPNANAVEAPVFGVATTPSGNAPPAGILPTVRIPPPSGRRSQAEPEVAGRPDFIVTSQLSGCLIAHDFSQSAYGPLMAHIEPKGVSAADLNQSFNTQPRKWATTDRAPAVFGRFDYGQKWCTVIGVCVGGDWELYAQERDGDRVARAYPIQRQR